jgi:hypothetical protein
MTNRINAHPLPPAFCDRRDTHSPRQIRIMVDRTADEFVPPKARGGAPPRDRRAASAHSDKPRAGIIVRFQVGAEIGFALQGVQPSASEIVTVGVAAFGIGRTDGADLDVPSVSQDILGSHRSMAARFGARRRHAPRPGKAAAPRENGTCVRRPRCMGE